MEKSKGMSRRSFVAGAGIVAMGAAAIGLTGCGSKASSDTGYSLAAADDGKWDSTSDVIVVGGGGAGLAAALEAAQSGASVTIIEAAAAVGGNTANSSGVIQAAGTDLQKKYTGITDDTPDKHAQYYIDTAEGSLDEDLVKYVCGQAPSAIEFMEGLGVTYEVVYGNGTVPYVDATLVLPRIHLAGTSDEGLQYGAWHIAALKAATDSAGVQYVFDTEATQLVQNSDGVITGVVAGDKRYKGSKGVILATCSYDRNMEMAKTFSQHMQWALEDKKAITVLTNTGGGIQMGMSVGADLAGMGGFIGLSNNIGGTPTLPGVPEVPGIIVNKYGRRFVSESDHYAWVLRQIFGQEEHIAWGVFDATAAALGGAVVGGVSPFSSDFSSEIANGSVSRADTIGELAGLIGVSSNNLQEAIDTWNTDMTTTKTDSQFPTRSCGLSAIDTPPYYATRMYDSNLGALGGLKVDTDAHVIDVQGNVISHLYAAGQVVGGFMGSFYPGTGTGVLSTVVLGRTAGKNAAAETVAS